MKLFLIHILILIICTLFIPCELATYPVYKVVQQAAKTNKHHNNHPIATEVIKPVIQTPVAVPKESLIAKEKPLRLKALSYEDRQEFGLKLRLLYMAIHEGLTTLYYRVIHESSFSLIYIKDTEISDEVILDIRKYKRILEDTVKRLWNCRFTQLHHEQFQIESNYHFDKTYELFEIKNVELFKKIKKNLSNGKENKGTMEIINKILNGIFRMSNHCVTKYQSVLRYNPSSMIKNELIDIGSQDIEMILDQGLPKGKKKSIRELVDEL